MVKIRLTRVGAKKRPYYRVHAIDSRKRRDGRALEYLGVYDPKPAPEVIDLRIDAIEAWVQKGAQLSDTVRSLMKRQAKAPRPVAEPEAPAAKAAAPTPVAEASPEPVAQPEVASEPEESTEATAETEDTPEPASEATDSDSEATDSDSKATESNAGESDSEPGEGA